MKSTIQQAKVCVIGKLVRKLKNPKQKELSKLQLIGKRSRLTDQIDYLKVCVAWPIFGESKSPKSNEFMFVENFQLGTGYFSPDI